MNILLIIAVFIIVNSGFVKLSTYSNKITCSDIIFKIIIFILLVYLLQLQSRELFENKKKYNKCIILSHNGIGDLINHIGAARYLETLYDEVLFGVSDMFGRNPDGVKKNIDYFIEPDSKIKTIIIKHADFKSELDKYKNTHDIYLGGEIKQEFYGSHSPYNIIPYCFYNDMEISTNIFWDYGHYRKLDESMQLYNTIKHMPYIIVSSKTKDGYVFLIEDVEVKASLDRNIILIISIDENIYKPGHKFYELAEQFVNKPLAYFADTFINAEQIFMTDSAGFCFALQLPIKTDKIYYKIRDTNIPTYDYLWDEKYGYNPSSKKKRFIQF